MEKYMELIVRLAVRFCDYVLANSIFYLMMLALLGLICYIAGEIIRKKSLTEIAQGQRLTIPYYKPLFLGLDIGGIALMLIAAILLYFAGGYDAFFAKVGW